MNGDLVGPMVNAYRVLDDRGAHHLADQPPRHRVGIAIDLDRTIGLHAPNQLTRSLEWRHAGDRFERLRLGAPEPFEWRLAGRAMHAHIGNIPRPGLNVCLEGFPAREGTAGDCVSLHIADPAFGLALGAGAIGCAGAWPETPVLGERLELLVKHDRARDRVMLDHQCPGIVEQDLLGHPAKYGERAFQPVEPTLLSFVAECPDVMPARITERGNKQIRANLAPADLD